MLKKEKSDVAGMTDAEEKQTKRSVAIVFVFAAAIVIGTLVVVSKKGIA